ncbi:PucR family transcriptional regulator [Arthrobacter ruber]|uniref:PucR family transcriptional regulator n=1 Tax=Arthrobacter ruber TaxID=1258893 RepID=UPI000CF3A421|nr:PucR family transcriptional regulator [Arthrobacter ruber]
MVSLVELSAQLGPHLATVGGQGLRPRQLSGVHVSELEDPTPYLEGGELLLTTGMPLIGKRAATSAYVHRLRAKGVHALGIGLGPWLAEVPDYLEEACSKAGIDLLTVPDGVPFQHVSRAFWGLSARSGQADLMGSLGTQTALARAAMRPDATSAVVRGLAQALGGWAAYLPVDSGTETFWPADTKSLVPLLHAETLRLNRTGAHSAATFELHGQPVVEYPIASGDHIHGFLAIGPGRTLTAADRQVIVTVCILLAIKARQREVVSSATAALGSAVAKLILHGQTEAARMLAVDVGLQDLPARVRVLGLRMHPDDDASSLVRAAPLLDHDAGLPALGTALATCLLRHEENGVLYVVLTADEGTPEPDASRVSFEDARESLAGALSDPVSLSEVPGAVPSVRQAVKQAPAGLLVAVSSGQDAQADIWVQALAAYSRADLVATVFQYLRHRGHWENASRDLGIHRNSVRHRIGIAQSLLGVSLDDPDVFAPLWLALRQRPN